MGVGVFGGPGFRVWKGVGFKAHPKGPKEPNDVGFRSQIPLIVSYLG